MVYRGKPKSRLGGLRQSNKRNIAFTGGSSTFNEATGKRITHKLGGLEKIRKDVLKGVSRALPRGVAKTLDNSIISDRKTQQKLNEMKKLGQAITHQVEIALPSAKAPIEFVKAQVSGPPKLSALQDKLLKRLESGDSNLTDKELEIVGNIQKGVDKAKTIGTTLVKKSIVKSLPKFSVGQQKLIDRVKSQISKQETKLNKLRKLLGQCENC